MKIKREYNYGDVFLVPRKTIVESRKECDTTVKLGQYTFDMPVCAANMKSVIDEETCEFFSKKSWFYVMHRFNIDPVKFTQNMHQKGFISSVSIGVNEDSYTDFAKFANTTDKPDYITLDIANAWCPKAERMTKWIKDTFPNTFLIVGNVATPEAVEEVQKWGADAIKAGIAGGCFVAGSPVKTDKGVKSIEDINVGDFVFTHKNRLRRVVATTSRKEEDYLLTVTCGGKKITTTPNHEFYVINKNHINEVTDENIHIYAEWIPAKELSPQYVLIKQK